MNAALQLLPATLLKQLEVRQSAKRKTVAIRVLADRVQVTVPSALSRAQWLPLVARKQAWIFDRQAKVRARLQETPHYRYCEGEQFPLLGSSYPLQITSGAVNQVQLVGAALQVQLSQRGRKPQPERVRAALECWYKSTAQRLLEQKSRALAETLGLGVGRVSVKLTRSKWGHCTSLGDLQYNWLIVQAPMAVVDYLVAHEVSHLRHPNHSAAFWSQVQTVCPDYAAARQWLKRFGHTLCL